MIQGLVSVILPVYNGETFLAEAITSILNQTYKNFEMLIIIDGSKDKSIDVARSFNDDRIIIIENEVNLGLVGALNLGIENARGEFIARMDQDDISLPERFAKQVTYLLNYPNTAILGTAFEVFGTENYVRVLPETPDRIKILALFESPFCHPSVMIRKSNLDKFNLRYNKEFKDIEDWRLWHDCIKNGLQLANLGDVLIRYRVAGQSTTTNIKSIRYKQRSKMHELSLKYLSEDFSESDIKLHTAFVSLYIGDVSINQYLLYLDKLLRTLIAKGYQKEDVMIILNPKLTRFMFKAMDRSPWSGLRVIFRYNLYAVKNFKYFFRRLFSLKKAVNNRYHEFNIT